MPRVVSRFTLLLFVCLSLTLFAQQADKPKPTKPTKPAVAADKPTAPKDKPSTDKPAATVTEAAETNTTDYSAEPFIFEKMRTSAKFENDGHERKIEEARIKVVSEAGVQALGQLVFGYNSATEKIEIQYVRVRKADGTVVTAGPDSVQDMTSPVTREAPIYTDFRQKHITVPGLRPGEVLEYSILRETTQPLAAGHFWFDYEFQKRAITLNEELELNVPKGRDIKLKAQPDYQTVVTNEGDRVIYRWKSSYLKRDSDDDDDQTVDRAKRIKIAKKKRKDAETADVQMTTFASWEEMGSWYAKLQGERQVMTPDMKAKVDQLIAGKTGTDRIEALYNFVAKNFRYVSLSFGTGRFQPHAAGDIFANQYGDCKDKHTLLATLLQSIGYRAYPVLIHSSRKLDTDVPSPSQFDHVITAVEVDGSLMWMDTTPEVAPFRLLSAPLRHKKALLTDVTSPRVVETPTDTPVPNATAIWLEGRVNDLGKFEGTMKYTLRGDGELVFRSSFRRIPKQNWKQFGQMLLNYEGTKLTVDDVKTSDPADTSGPFTVDMKVSQVNFLDWTRKRFNLDLPLSRIQVPDADDEPDADDDPIELGIGVEVVSTLKMELPEKFTARAPLPISLKRDYAEYGSTYKLDGRMLTAERRLKITARDLPVSRTSDFLAFRRALLADEQQTMAMEMRGGAGDAIPEGKAEDLFEAANAALRNGDAATAKLLYEKVVEKEPKHKQAWYGLATAYDILGQRDKSEQMYRKQIEVEPYHNMAYYALGYVMMRAHKYPEAEEMLRKQLEIQPLHEQAYGTLGALYIEMKRFQDAADALEKAISVDPDSAQSYVALGQAQLGLGQSDKAIASFEKAFERAQSPDVWNNVAYELSKHKVQLDRAQQYAESAVAATSARLRNVSIDRLTMEDVSTTASLAAQWDTLGWVHFQRGEVDEAERWIRAAWLLSQHGEVGDHLGQILEKRGNRNEAIRMYALAMSADQPVDDSRDHLAALLGKDKVDGEVSKLKPELPLQRTIRLGKLIPDSATAEFFFVLGPGGVVESLKFVKGDERLKTAADRIRKEKFVELFPDKTPTRLVRRAIVACDANAGCSLVMIPVGDVRSLN